MTTAELIRPKNWSDPIIPLKRMAAGLVIAGFLVGAVRFVSDSALFVYGGAIVAVLLFIAVAGWLVLGSAVWLLALTLRKAIGKQDTSVRQSSGPSVRRLAWTNIALLVFYLILNQSYGGVAVRISNSTLFMLTVIVLVFVTKGH